MIIPFAYLINSQTDKVLSLLETWTVTTSSGPRNALPVFLEAWCDNADAFQGSWNIRVSTLALTHLFMSARPSLANITVRGERILTAANVDTIMTRSKARASKRAACVLASSAADSLVRPRSVSGNPLPSENRQAASR